METFLSFASQPFVWGLALGLLVAGFLARSAWTARGHFKREILRLREEIAQLQQHINTHLRLTASGSEKLEKEIAELKRQNETLRINLATAQQKPGRAEVQQLQVYEAAAAQMREQAPGFASAWEQALRQARSEQEAAESGLSRLVRRILPGAGPAAPSGESTPLIAPPEPPKPA